MLREPDVMRLDRVSAPLADAVADRPSADRASEEVRQQAPAAQSSDAATSEKPPAKYGLRRLLLVGIGSVALAGGTWYGWNYWTVGRFQIATDDAYVQAETTTIAPKISGYIGQVLASDNERVTAGQVLALIDARDYQVALSQADADVAAAQATVAARQAAIDAQQSAIDSARATVALDEANEKFSGQENRRYTDLAATGYGSVQNAQQAASRNAASRASIQRDAAALDSAVKQVALQKAELAQAAAMLTHQQAVRSQAQLNLGYTMIVSPVDGIVGNRSLRLGQYVQAGTQLMAVVPSADAYVIANYKETQLTSVHRGQKVEVEVDMFPGRVYHGHVDSLAPASGQSFALLPPDNATGNFTKIVQRIPVKITLDPSGFDPADLRPGMSVTPSINTGGINTGGN